MNRFFALTGRTDWETPKRLFDRLAAEHGPFDLDPCATPENAKCSRFYYWSPAGGGLNELWLGTVYMNPPYGRQIGKWVEKAYRSALAGSAKVVCLLPARTDTAWFHDYVLGKGRMEFLRGRVRFSGSKHNAPFPCMVVVYDKVSHEENFYG